MKRNVLSLLLALVLMAGLMPAALAAESLDNFQKVNAYTDGTFTDVAADSWYAGNVRDVYELDLVKGSSATTFSPSQNLTISSTLALACRLHSIYHTGKADFVQGEPWYRVYVDYAVENGIIASDEFTDYNATATRRQFAGILVKALPAGELEAINTIEDGAIPDLTMRISTPSTGRVSSPAATSTAPSSPRPPSTGPRWPPSSPAWPCPASAGR